MTQPVDRQAWFTTRELRRVGTAATMIAVCGTLIIFSVILLLGHYNPLVHCTPKAILDGVAVTLLIGMHGRWRCLALLGVVYGFVLLLQIGVFYLLPVMTLAGLIAAGAGRIVQPLHRPTALFLAAALYEFLAGFGAPIKIYFGTGGKDEPIVWGLWFAEWPLRIGGGMIGAWIALRWLARERTEPAERMSQPELAREIGRAKRIAPSGFVRTMMIVVGCAIACTVPMMVESPLWLALIAGAFLLFSVIFGARLELLHAGLGLVFGWFTFGVLSYLWHRDMDRVVDLYRTLVLRFLPLAIASTTLVTTVRPIDLVKALRKLRISPVIILPLASVARAIPQAKRSMRASISTLRAEGHWRGPWSILRRPKMIIRSLVLPQINRWADDLSKH